MRQKKIQTLRKLLRGRCLMLFLLTSLGTMTIQAQNITVTGTISDDKNGMPIPGVNILLKDTSTGTVTNFDGKYTIKAKIGDVLLFNYMGMKDKAVTVTQSTMDVTLEESLEDLEEVVVIGYGTQKKREITGAVGRVKAQDIENIVTSDLGNALQGQVAGVNITTSAEPGGQSEILIRGITSISGSNTPLFVVDGIPQEGDPGIPPTEIESIDILKDAASAAIYGTRGAAGVILITTRQGREGSLSIKLNASYGLQHITSGTPLMNTAQQTYFNLVRDRNQTGSTDDITVLNFTRSPLSFQNDTDLSELVFIDNAPIQNYTVNVSGGTSDITYSVITNLYEKEGIIINSNFKRFSTRVNTTYSRGKWRVNATAGLDRGITDRSPGGIITQTVRYYPTQQGLNINSDDPLISLRGDESNRLGWVIDSFDNTDNARRIKSYAQFNVDYEFFKDLNITARVGINETNEIRERFNGYTPVFNAVSGEELSNPSSSFVQNDASRWSSATFDSFLTYKKHIGDHNLTFTAGASREEFVYRNFIAKKHAVASNNIRVLNNATLNPDARSGGNYTNTIVGYISRIQYNYKGRYLLSSSVRRDGSSKFGLDKRWGTFPSISVGWNISDEPFWAPVKNAVNNFKLRASRGTVGNERFSSYAFSAGISQGIDYAFGSEEGVLNLGAAQSQFSNALVQWETSIQNNIGLDISLFKNKFTLSAEYYDTKKEDMLFPIVLPGSTGGGNNSQVVLNVGNMTNKGVELSAGYRGDIGNLSFRMNGVFTTNENKITKINGEGGFLFTNDFGLISGAKSSSQVTVLAEGYEAGAFFLYPTNGVVDTPEKLAEYQQLEPNAELGDLIYVDSNGSGDISDADRVYSGSGLPEYEIGYNLNLDYKGFDLSMQWYAALGHELMNGAEATAYGYGRHRDLIYAWSNANQDSPIPAYRGNVKDHPNYKGYTDLWLEKGDYLRLKNVTLGYSIPTRITEKLGIFKFRIYVTAQNALTITDYEGFDPEVGGGIQARGLDKGRYPITSQYIFGLNFNF